MYYITFFLVSTTVAFTGFKMNVFWDTLICVHHVPSFFRPAEMFFVFSESSHLSCLILWKELLVSLTIHKLSDLKLLSVTVAFLSTFNLEAWIDSVLITRTLYYITTGNKNVVLVSYWKAKQWFPKNILCNKHMIHMNVLNWEVCMSSRKMMNFGWKSYEKFIAPYFL